MATIRTFTDLEQSRKLAEILPIETSDMIYTMTNGYHTPFVRIEKVNELYEDDICAWSLTALLGALPEIQGGKPMIALDDNYITYPHISDLHTKANNLIDAAFDMVIKLHEKNLL